MAHHLEPPPAAPHPTDTPAPAEPAFLARARRTLAGDVRPEDYLPVPDSVREAIDEEFRRFAREDGTEATPESYRFALNRAVLPILTFELSTVSGQSPVRKRAEVALDLRARTGAWHPLVLRVDTGAELCAMSAPRTQPRSEANAAGLNLATARTAHRSARVHVGTCLRSVTSAGRNAAPRDRRARAERHLSFGSWPVARGVARCARGRCARFAGAAVPARRVTPLTIRLDPISEAAYVR